MMESVGYKMYSAMYMQKGLFPNAVVIGDYDQIRGFSSMMEEVGLPVQLKICNHSVAGIEDEDIIKMSKEKDKIETLKNVNNAVVLGDEISLHMCNDTCEKIVTAFPLVYHTQIAKHLPFVGIKGMDYILESIDRYFGRM